MRTPQGRSEGDPKEGHRRTAIRTPQGRSEGDPKEDQRETPRKVRGRPQGRSGGDPKEGQGGSQKKDQQRLTLPLTCCSVARGNRSRRIYRTPCTLTMVIGHLS